MLTPFSMAYSSILEASALSMSALFAFVGSLMVPNPSLETSRFVFPSLLYIISNPLILICKISYKIVMI
ncbi:hypothetical protein [Methanobrevibacter sp.]|uniref:hypothetical protein n=1 Tax=Methanobrevibacter sp. TaxID=66852 RepID=UPI00386644A5